MIMFGQNGPSKTPDAGHEKFSANDTWMKMEAASASADDKPHRRDWRDD
jgi:hypothetical protein